MKKKKIDIMDIATTMHNMAKGSDGIKSDVQGSYTGTSEDGGRPIQDADDL